MKTTGKYNFWNNQDSKANNELMHFDGNGEFGSLGKSYNKQADGQSLGNSLDSEPFIVKVTNGTTDEQTDLVLLNAGKQFGKSASNYGLPTGVTLTYLVPGIDYDQFLSDVFTSNAFIGQIYLESAITANLTAPMSVETYDVLGKTQSNILDLPIDPYQQSTTATVHVKRFAWNKFTKLTLSSLAASSSLTFRFYPMAVDLAQETKEFVSPQIAKPADRGLMM